MAKLCVAPRDVEVTELGRIPRLFAPISITIRAMIMLGQRTVCQTCMMNDPSSWFDHSQASAAVKVAFTSSSNRLVKLSLLRS